MFGSETCCWSSLAGANGELAAAMQYTIQGWNCVDDLGRRDMLLDIGTGGG